MHHEILIYFNITANTLLADQEVTGELCGISNWQIYDGGVEDHANDYLKRGSPLLCVSVVHAVYQKF
jgi:hypothetical protein